MWLVQLAILMVLAAAPAASAQTYYPVSSSGSFSVDGFTFTANPSSLGSCSYQLNNGAATGCSNDDIEVSVTASRGSVTITYVNSTNPGSPLLSQATANGCTCVTYYLSVQSTSALTAASVAIAGYGQSGATQDNWLEVYNTPSTKTQAMVTTSGYSSTTSTYVPSPNTTSLNLELSLGVNAAYNPGVFSLSSASLTFTNAPEPGTAWLLLPGLVGLIIVGFRRRRSA